MRNALIRVFVLVLVVVACSSDEGSDPVATTTGSSTTEAPTTTGAPATTATPTTTAPPTTEATNNEEEATVALSASDLGEILVDEAGFTLYLFVPDNQGESVCYDQCESAWPPLVAATTAGEGVDATLFSTSPRTDGSIQATYNGWPLYYFANDLKPGEANGQGVNDVWYVVDVAGEPVR